MIELKYTFTQLTLVKEEEIESIKSSLEKVVREVGEA